MRAGARSESSRSQEWEQEPGVRAAGARRSKDLGHGVCIRVCIIMCIP